MKSGDSTRGTAPSVQRRAVAGRRGVVPAVLLVLALLTFAAYLQAPSGAILEYDDESYITKNQVVLHGLTREGAALIWRGSYAGLWSPMTWLSYMLDVELFGPSARAFHVVNVLFHAVNALLLFLLVRALHGTLWRSALVAALFAVHPLHVESVAWISGRKDLLATLFGLLALLAYVRYARRPTLAAYGVVTVAFALGLASKSMLVTWPLLMLGLDVWPLGRVRGPVVNTSAWPVVEKIPWFVLSAAAAMLSYRAQVSGGAVTPLDQDSLAFRIGNAVHSCGAILGKTLLPRALSPFYPYRQLSLASTEVLGAALALGALAALCVVQRRRRPWLACAGGWYLLSLVPALGFVRVGLHSMADRFTYIPLIGPFLAVAWVAAEWAGPGRARRAVVGASLSFVVSLLAALTWVQVGHWRDDRAVFAQMTRAVDGNFFGLYHLGVLNEREGNLPEAERLYREGLRANPYYGEPHARLGAMLAGTGRAAEAVVEFREAVALGQGSPLVNYLFGVTLLSLGEPEAALDPLREAIRSRPDFAEAHNNLGVALDALGRLDEAGAHFRRALEIDPTLTQARENLGMAEAARRAGGAGSPDLAR